MRSVHVVAGVIVRAGKVLAAHRPTSASGAGWEFPGGKVEPGETGEQALRRELLEELDLLLSTVRLLGSVEHDYPRFRLLMDCYLCTPGRDAVPVAAEHDELRWVGREELAELDWLAADERVVDLLEGDWERLIARSL